MTTYPICDYAVDIALVYLLKKSSYKKNASSHKDYVRTKGYSNSTLKPLSFLSVSFIPLHSSETKKGIRQVQ